MTNSEVTDKVWSSFHGYFCLCVSLTGAEESEAAVRNGEREKRSLPYWGLWSSDFFGWLEELRAQAAYDGMQDLAHTFWAHFPISSELGYDSPEADSELGE